MTQHRHYTHIIAAENTASLYLAELALYLEDKAFYTQDLPLTSSVANGYSRRCIDVCDFAILLVLDSYGELNPTGVSQMHLSYLTVKTKDKPLLIFIKTPLDEPRSRQLTDFIQMVEERGPQQLYYFQDLESFKSVLATSYEAFAKTLDTSGWTSSRPKPLATSRTNPEKTLVDQAMKSEATRNKRDDLLAQSSLSELERLDALMQIQTTEPESIETNHHAMNVSVTPTSKSHNDNLDDLMTLNYDAHAYQHGNLKDVSLVARVSWRKILTSLSGLNSPFTTEVMHRTLNDMVAKQAYENIANVLPMAHAVSRCQVTTKDFQWLLDELQAYGWLVPARSANTNTGRSSKTYWELTKTALNQLDGVCS